MTLATATYLPDDYRVPDVRDYAGPLLDGLLQARDRLSAGDLVPDEYLAEVAAQLRRTPPEAARGAWIARVLAERRDLYLYRETTEANSAWLQLVYVRPFEVHPPHAHRNLLTNQTLMRGRIYLREYDRVARLDEKTLLLKLRSDGWMRPGEHIAATEIDRNVHWFCADDEPAVLLSFAVYGYQPWTFDAVEASHRRDGSRTYLDPTSQTLRDGLIIAEEIDTAAAMTRFRDRPIKDFPRLPQRGNTGGGARRIA